MLLVRIIPRLSLSGLGGEGMMNEPFEEGEELF